MVTMTDAIEALRRELGFVIDDQGFMIFNHQLKNMRKASKFEWKLWSALLASRERNAKLVRAMKDYLAKMYDWEMTAYEDERGQKRWDDYIAAKDKLARLLDERKDGTK